MTATKQALASYVSNAAHRPAEHGGSYQIGDPCNVRYIGDRMDINAYLLRENDDNMPETVRHLYCRVLAAENRPPGA